jgi:transcriptional regulator with XRE-family HTH domain
MPLDTNAVEEDLMITASQMRAARALLGIDQRQLAELSGVSVPTIQRMEASEETVRGVIDTLTKIVEAFDAAGIELIGENAVSGGSGRGVRLKQARNAAGKSD